MQKVLDRIKEDNRKIEAEKNSPWLIQETREKQVTKTEE